MGCCPSKKSQPVGNTPGQQNIPPPPVMPTPPSNNLPQGWICQYDLHSRHLFYVNTATGQRQWEHPNGAAAGAADSAQFRDQMALYEQGLANYNRMYANGPRGAPQMSQQSQRSTGGGGMGSMLKGGMVGFMASSLLRNRSTNRNNRSNVRGADAHVHRNNNSYRGGAGGGTFFDQNSGGNSRYGGGGVGSQSRGGARGGRRRRR